jgi:AGZA family xanthine/uracil permease-like MFS transporter
LDNLAGLVLIVSLLVGVYDLPASFALRYMIPGTAMGVLVGDLLFTWMAFRLARTSGRNDITAMPLGLDTPSTFGMIFFVIGPAYQQKLAALQGTDLPDTELTTAAATYAWHIGICAILLSGVFKIACSFGSGWIRRAIPRAGLLGSLAAIALVLISFFPLIEVFHYPVVGFASLAIILTTLTARVTLPGRIPGALAALVVGSVIYYAMQWAGVLGVEPPAIAFEPRAALLPTQWMGVFTFEWLAAFEDAIKYVPVLIPFALATVVGGIDCTESAAAAGDEYQTGRVIATEGVATVVAALCGGVIQTTPYIGHPAYKAMGGRAAYTLATALFIGSAGLLGYFGYLYVLIPKAAIYPIMIFIALEITSQSYHATPKRHYPAVAIACLPAMAYLIMIFADGLLAQSGKTLDTLGPPLGAQLQTIRTIAGSGGFIITSLLWASTLVAMLDRRLKRAAMYLAVCAVCSLFSMIHSPFADGRMAWPWNIDSLPAVAAGQTPIYVAAGYAVAAMIMFVWGLGQGRNDKR